MSRYDAVVVGAGPNGLAAAIELARHGLSVTLLEANDTVGGAARTEESTLPGYLHDVGSAIYPLGVASPFFASLPLQDHGLEWLHSEHPVAHPFDDGSAALLHRSLEATADELGLDGARYARAFAPFVQGWPDFIRDRLDSPLRIPSHPLTAARFAPFALQRADQVARSLGGERVQALFAGNAAHAGTPLDHRLAGAVGAVLMSAAHAGGWPFPKGGAGRLTEALASCFRSLGGTIKTGVPVRSLDEIPRGTATILALTYGQVARLRGTGLPVKYQRRLARWRYGPAACKVDWALDGPIPWAAADVARASTVHLGGTLEEIVASERAPWHGSVSESPFVLLAQPSLVDPTRAPEGRHTAWAYCHVPNGWRGDATTLIESQVERFAPGFRERVLGRSVKNPADLERWDENLVGGDVNGGALTLHQTIGPGRWGLRDWSTPVSGLYIGSSSTPPGGGVHGMCGFHAARAALRQTFRITPKPLGTEASTGTRI
jgi:phytoene dehydrogenase-like protein